MLVVETVVRIRRERASGKAIKAIARDLRLSRKVVRKAIRAPEGAFDYHRTVQPLPRLGRFQERIDVLLTENEARHRRDRRFVRVLATVMTDGLESVEAAIREALDDGAASDEVILNIMARYRELPSERTLDMVGDLKLSHPPIADCARYDTVRGPDAAA